MTRRRPDESWSPFMAYTVALVWSLVVFVGVAVAVWHIGLAVGWWQG